MLALCRGDQEDELEVLLDEGNCDVSYVDGAGNSAAHYAWVKKRYINNMCSFFF